MIINKHGHFIIFFVYLCRRRKVEKEINEGKEEKGKKTQEVADSQLNDPEKPPSVTDLENLQTQAL